MTIYCAYEQNFFPESEFIHRKNGTLLRPHIHDVNPVHFAEGSVIDQSNPPSTSSLSGHTSQRPGPVTPGPVTFNPNDPIIVEPDTGDRDRKNYDDSWAALRILYQMAQNMSLNELQVLITHAKDLGNQRNEQ